MRSQVGMNNGGRGSPKFVIPGSRMEDDSVLLSAVGMNMMEEEQSMISYAQFSSQRQAPVPPAPRAMSVIKRGIKQYSGNNNHHSHGKIRDKRPINMRNVPGGKKRHGGKFDRPPELLEASMPKVNPFGPNMKPLKRHPHEYSITRMYKKLSIAGGPHLHQASPPRRLQQQQQPDYMNARNAGRGGRRGRGRGRGRDREGRSPSPPPGVVMIRDSHHNTSHHQQQLQQPSLLSSAPKKTVISMYQSTVSPSAHVPLSVMQGHGQMMEHSDDMLMSNSLLNHSSTAGGGGGGGTLAALISGMANNAQDLDEEYVNRREVMGAMKSMMKTVEERVAADPGPESDVQSVPTAPVKPTIEELGQDLVDKQAEFERCRERIKGWITAFEEAFGRIPGAEDRKVERVMFRNFNVAKAEMHEAQEVLEDALKEQHGGMFGGGMLNDVSQLTMEGGLMHMVEGVGAGLLKGPVGPVEGHIGNGNFLIVGGEVVNNNRRIQYRVLEYHGACFSIEFLVLSTQQKWVLFVPSSNEISYLLRVWNIRANHENSIKFGDWMLRSSSLTLMDETITGATFDSATFRRRCHQETMVLIVGAAVVVQRAWRKVVMLRRYQSARRQREEVKKSIKVAQVRTAIRNIAGAKQAIDQGSALVLQTRMKGASIAPTRGVFTINPRHATAGYSRRVSRKMERLQREAPDVEIFNEYADPSLLEAMSSVLQVPPSGGDESRYMRNNDSDSAGEEDLDFGSFNNSQSWVLNSPGRTGPAIPSSAPAGVKPRNGADSTTMQRSTKSAGNARPVPPPSLAKEEYNEGGGGDRVDTASSSPTTVGDRGLEPRPPQGGAGRPSVGGYRSNSQRSRPNNNHNHSSSPSRAVLMDSVSAKNASMGFANETELLQLKAEMAAALNNMQHELSSVRMELDVAKGFASLDARARAGSGDYNYDNNSNNNNYYSSDKKGGNSSSSSMSGSTQGGSPPDMRAIRDQMAEMKAKFEQQLEQERQEKKRIAEELQEERLKNMVVDTGTPTYKSLSTKAARTPTPATAAGADRVADSATIDKAAADANAMPTASEGGDTADTAVRQPVPPEQAVPPTKSQQRKKLFGLF